LVYLLLANVLLAAFVFAGDGQPRNVLIVFADEPGWLSVSQASLAITNALKEPDPAATAVYHEYLDLGRIGNPAYSKSAVRWYQEKYAGVRLDAIIAGAAPALAFLLEHRAELWTNVPIVFGVVPRAPPYLEPLPPDVTGVYSASEYEKTL